MIESQAQLEKQIAQWGFMPFFHNQIEGFSIEENMPSDLLFGEHAAPNEDGAWQWKGPIIMHWQAAYGKFFGSKAGFVSLDWLPDFMNWRRSKYPEDLLTADERTILATLREHESLLSKELKRASGFSLTRKRYRLTDDARPVAIERNGTSFDSLIARLQMGTYVCIADFEYSVSKQGQRYGWGVARYCTPEAMYEFDYREAVGHRTPDESRRRIVEHLTTLFPEADKKKVEKLV